MKSATIADFRERDKLLPSSNLGINDAYRLLSASGEPEEAEPAP